MWIRLETNWQEDPFIVTLDGAARHILSTIWCIAADHGFPTFDADGEPLHATLPLQYLEPSYVARRSGFPVDVAIRAIESIRRPIGGTDWSPEIPARLTIDAASGTAVVRNVAKYQRKILKDRARKAVRSSADHRQPSAEPPRPSAESSEIPRKVAVTKRNDTNETNEKTSPPPLPAQEVVDAWNAVASKHGLSKVKESTDDRKRKIQARGAGRDLAWWRALFEKVAATPFLRGDNARGWKANLDFVIRSDTSVAKILEGSYENGAGANANPLEARRATLDPKRNYIGG